MPDVYSAFDNGASVLLPDRRTQSNAEFGDGTEGHGGMPAESFTMCSVCVRITTCLVNFVHHLRLSLSSVVSLPSQWVKF